MKPRIVVFTQVAVPGQGKTRLTSVLTPALPGKLHDLLVPDRRKQLKSFHLALAAKVGTGAGSRMGGSGIAQTYSYRPNLPHTPVWQTASTPRYAVE